MVIGRSQPCSSTMRKLFLLVILLISSQMILARNGRGSNKITHDVPWDPRVNSLQFGSVHSIDVHIDEYMDIFCPQYDADAQSTLKFIIYNVSKQAFTECAHDAESRRIFECDAPSLSKKLTTKFQQRSPNPLGFVYRPGHTYYYMSFVDTEDDVSNCENALRLAVNVHPKLRHQHPKVTPVVGVSTSSHARTESPTSTSTTTTTTPTTPTKTSRKTPSATKKPTVGGKFSPREDENENTGGGSSSQIKCSLAWIVVTLSISALLHG